MLNPQVQMGQQQRDSLLNINISSKYLGLFACVHYQQL